MGLAEPYGEHTIRHATGTVAIDSTAGMFMKVIADDIFSPSTDASVVAEGILHKDRDAGALCTILMGGPIKLETVLGGAVAGDEIEVDAATAFPTKLVSGKAQGKIIKMDGVYYVVKMYV